MSYHIQGVYIADGFADDCDELMHRCIRDEVLTFEVFADIWKEMQLSCIYQGRTSGAEIAELSEEVLHIAKHYMVADTSNFEESVAGLFLVYSLLNLQPFAGFASLRIVQEDLPAIERIELVARRDRRQDVLYILASVLIQGPVQYHAVLRERGMEYPLRKYLEGYSTIDKLGVRPKGVFYRQNTELDIIRDLKNLTMRYVTAKENIMGLRPYDRNLSYLDQNFPVELDTSLKNIISGIIDNDENDEDSTGSVEAIKNIKDKAMKTKVNPIRHRIGVSTRGPSNPHTSDIKTSPGKIKTTSPSKVTTSYKNKAKKPPQKPTRKRTRKRRYNQMSSEDDDDDDYAIKQDSEYHTDEDDNSETDDLDMTKFHQAKLLKTDVNEQEIDLKIDALPCVIRSDDHGHSYEIEIIDKLGIVNKGGGPNVLQEASTSASTSASASSEGDKLKKTDKRDLKKTILKSRFKRLGMLPVANFQSK